MGSWHFNFDKLSQFLVGLPGLENTPMNPSVRKVFATSVGSLYNVKAAIDILESIYCS